MKVKVENLTQKSTTFIDNIKTTLSDPYSNMDVESFAKAILEPDTQENIINDARNKGLSAPAIAKLMLCSVYILDIQGMLQESHFFNLLTNPTVQEVNTAKEKEIDNIKDEPISQEEKYKRIMMFLASEDELYLQLQRELCNNEEFPNRTKYNYSAQVYYYNNTISYYIFQHLSNYTGNYENVPKECKEALIFYFQYLNPNPILTDIIDQQRVYKNPYAKMELIMLALKAVEEDVSLLSPDLWKSFSNNIEALQKSISSFEAKPKARKRFFSRLPEYISNRFLDTESSYNQIVNLFIKVCGQRVKFVEEEQQRAEREETLLKKQVKQQNILKSSIISAAILLPTISVSVLLHELNGIKLINELFQTTSLGHIVSMIGPGLAGAVFCVSASFFCEHLMSEPDPSIFKEMINPKIRTMVTTSLVLVANSFCIIMQELALNQLAEQYKPIIYAATAVIMAIADLCIISFFIEHEKIIM